MTGGRALQLTVCFLRAACGGRDASSKTLEDHGYDPRYKQLTRALLEHEPDSSLESAVMQHIVWTIDQDYDRERQIVDRLSPGLQTIYTTYLVETEVNNGGFNQYFFNPAGRMADIALAGFRTLGATEHEGLMREALAVYERVRPRLDSARKTGTMEAFSETYEDGDFEALDRRFYDLDTDLSALRIQYIRTHLDQFADR